MTRNRSVKGFLLYMSLMTSVTCFTSARQVNAQEDLPTVPYQGQNTNRFQMFFGPMARADAYLVDTEGGMVRQMVTSKTGEVMFEKVLNEQPPIVGKVPGRYRVYFGPMARADAFLVDTLEGRVWQFLRDTETKAMFLRQLKVESLNGVMTW